MGLAEGHGWPVAIDVFAANFHEASLVEPLIADNLRWLPKPENLLGDTAFSSQPLSHRLLIHHGINLTAPPKKHYVHPFHDGRRLRRGRRRWKIERCWAWLKNNHRLEIRREFYSENYLGFAQLAVCRQLLTVICG